jgi:hypothetical protein
MPKYYLTTTRTCLVEYVHVVEAADATEAERLMEDEGEGRYLGCTVGESLDLCDDDVEISAERPSIVYPDEPATPHLLQACEQAEYWLTEERANPGQAEPDMILRVLRAALATARGGEGA